MPPDMLARMQAAREAVAAKPPGLPAGSMPLRPAAPPQGMAGGVFGMARPPAGGALGAQTKAPMMTGQMPGMFGGQRR